MNHVFVVDAERKPLSMCHPARARALLREGKAAVLRLLPFTVILKEVMPDAVVKPMKVKIDPGSKTTGIALVDTGDRVLFAAELTHRGQAIKNALESRRALRRGRRNRNTRYRAARFDNRTRKAGWLPPSLLHRVDTTMTWVSRFSRFALVDELAVERVKFDMQLMQNPEMSGVEYQQGTLMGFTVKEYVLEKFHRKCVYCDATGVPFDVDHIHPSSKGGSDRVSNLALACVPCNQSKGNMPVEVFVKDATRLKRMLAQVKAPLKDAAAVNATRNAIFTALLKTGLPVEAGTGAETKFNRKKLGLPKAHWIDAACVGTSGATVTLDAESKPLLIKATGHGTRQMCGTDKYGFPVRHRTRQKTHFGFETGDLVLATVPSGKKAGIHKGRVLCRATGSFDIQTKAGRVAGISYRHCTNLFKRDGYAYS